MTGQEQRKPELLKYAAYGLTIGSQWFLPELVAVKRSRPADVRIRRGRVKTRGFFSTNGRYAEDFSAGHARFYWKGESAIHVSRGKEIVVQAFQRADEKAVRLSILGPAFSQLLAQKGFLVLHASAVRTSKGAVAFLGGSGIGKSTLAAALYDAGFPFITDNLLAICFKDGKPLVYPAFPQLKLWPNSVKALGLSPEKLPKLESATQKRLVCPQKNFTLKPIVLSRLYLLSVGKKADIGKPIPSQKLLELVRHSYGLSEHSTSGSLTAHFQNCAQLLARVPIYGLTRTRNFSSLIKCVRLVRNHSEIS